MRISQLIEWMKETQAEHGDLRVYTSDSDWGNGEAECLEITDVEIVEGDRYPNITRRKELVVYVK